MDRITVFGVIDGGGEQLFEGQASETPVQFAPGRYGAGHRDGVPAALRHGIVAFGLHLLEGLKLRRAAAAVEPVKFAAEPDEVESVRAKPVSRGLQYGHADRRGDHGVDGVAALFQNVQSGLGRQRLRGADHAFAPVNDAAARRITIIQHVEFHDFFLRFSLSCERTRTAPDGAERFFEAAAIIKQIRRFRSCFSWPDLRCREQMQERGENSRHDDRERFHADTKKRQFRPAGRDCLFSI